MVLYLFVAAYVAAVEEPIWEPIPGQRVIGPVLGRGALHRGLDRRDRDLARVDRQPGPDDQGRLRLARRDRRLLLERFLVAFEAASMLLLIAAVGAIVLAGGSEAVLG